MATLTLMPSGGDYSHFFSTNWTLVSWTHSFSIPVMTNLDVTNVSASMSVVNTTEAVTASLYLKDATGTIISGSAYQSGSFGVSASGSTATYPRLWNSALSIQATIKGVLQDFWVQGDVGTFRINVTYSLPTSVGVLVT